MSLWMTTACAHGIEGIVAPPPSVIKAVIGKTKDELLACTNISPDQRRLGGGVMELIFYKEASLLEESYPGSRSSFPQAHHGCLAHLRLKDGRVEDIHYHAIPESYAGFDHCDAIFASCLNQ